MRQRFSLTAAAVVAVTLLVVVLVTALRQSEPPEPPVVAPALSHPSRYGLLTSARWAYGAKYEKTDLEPIPNPNPHPEPQPNRERPNAAALTPDGRKLYVAQGGTAEKPGRHVAVFDVETRKVVRRIEVGSYPHHLALHPGGRFLVVLNRLSNYASVIDSQTDRVVAELPTDFYCMRLVFTADGRRAYVSNRYLDQVLVLDLEAGDGTLRGAVRPIGGFDETAFVSAPGGDADLHQILRRSCGGARCHARTRGGLYAGEDGLKTFFSAVDASTPGDPAGSLLLRAVLSVQEGGFADDLGRANFHAGGLVVWKKTDPDYQAVARWIARARLGPGIPIGDRGSKPGPLVLGPDERYLYVGHQGTLAVSIVDLEKHEEVSAIHTQTLTLDLAVVRDPVGARHRLVASSLGLGFGAARERDPIGGEVTDRRHPAAQFTVLRDLETTEVLPIAEQKVLGTFDGVDGTAAFKMADIQNDLLAVDLSRLRVPEPVGDGPQLQYALMANRYEAHEGWVRYTSDSAEILPHDISGDIPPALHRVVGTQPERIAVDGDRLFVAMLGSYELVEWRVDANPGEATDVLEPVAVYRTGINPVDVVIGRAGTPAEGLVFVINEFGETVSVIKRGGVERDHREFEVGDLSRPFPDTDAERGQMFVLTSVFSVDGDTSCQSCHIHGTSDGRGWGAGQAIAQTRDGKFVNGGLLGIPALRNLVPNEPFYFEGTHQAFDGQLDDAREHVALNGFLEPNPHGDFTRIEHPTPRGQRREEHEEIQDKMSTDSWGPFYYDLRERRDELSRRLTMRYFGKAFAFRDFQRFIGAYQVATAQLSPNPFDQRHPSVQRGRLLFGDLGVGCVNCHKPPNFTDKTSDLAHNEERALPAIVTFTAREGAFTLAAPHFMDRVNGFVRDLEYWEKGRIERVQGLVTTFPLRGLFDRPFTFLHHGRALTLRETFAAPNHYSLRRFRYPRLRGGELVRPDGLERGFNELTFLEERTYVMDTHGATSHLDARQVADLENFLLSIE